MQIKFYDSNENCCRISLTFEKSRPFLMVKCKNGEVFYIFFKLAIKRYAEQYDAWIEEA